MDNRTEVRAFLKSRRDRVTADEAGVASFGERRVPGLRRSEVAQLAGVSVEYYTRLERGNLSGVSDSVLDAVASALRLDATERSHLHDLARAASSSPRRAPRPKAPSIRPGLQRAVDAIESLPALVTNYRFDVLLTNALGRALFSELFDDPAAGSNTARFVFLSPAARRFYVDWDLIARTAVGTLRVEAAKNPYDRELSNLIGELSTRSDAFRVLWGAHDVRVFRDGTKRFHHPAVGPLDLDHETMVLASDEQVVVAVYSAAPDTPAADGLKLLASWAATGDQTPTSPRRSKAD
jgi:transcriptional regulator with XRE-family HTH domain